MKKLKWIVALVIVIGIVFGVVQYVKTSGFNVNPAEFIIMYLMFLCMK